MRDNPVSISDERLQRLRPSDIGLIKSHLADKPFMDDLVAKFSALVLRLDHPDAYGLDDLRSIALQLKTAGVWDVVDPAAFVARLERMAHRSAVACLSEALLPYLDAQDGDEDVHPVYVSTSIG